MLGACEKEYDNKSREKCAKKNPITSTHQIFDRACEQFLDKWKSETEFISYFENEWLNRFWYLGASPGTPATNNALEAFNKTIKDRGTLRELHPLARFLVIASDMVKD